MPGKKIPVDQFHDIHHPDAWFEYWHHDAFFYGHLDLPEEPTSAQEQESEEENCDYNFGRKYNFHG